jgi:hypothetical protein
VPDHLHHLEQHSIHLIRGLTQLIAVFETTRSEERAGRAMDQACDDAYKRLRAAGCN